MNLELSNPGILLHFFLRPPSQHLCQVQQALTKARTEEMILTLLLHLRFLSPIHIVSEEPQAVIADINQEEMK